MSVPFTKTNPNAPQVFGFTGQLGRAGRGASCERHLKHCEERWTPDSERTMDFEVIFRLKGNELARYRFPVETPGDIEAGVTHAIEMFRVARPDVDLLGDGMDMVVHKVWEDDT
jgi:hypothetical protein